MVSRWVVNCGVTGLKRVFREKGDIFLTMVKKIATKGMNGSFLFGVEQVPPD